MEILIKQKKELTLSIKSGFYSEELMKTELKFKPPLALTLNPHLYMWNCSIEYMFVTANAAQGSHKGNHPVLHCYEDEKEEVHQACER